ncbi:serine/threonine-protein kinase [Abyssibacter sp.]|uniref:serine/threonine-protein kinase n=1 Tax=Abyssibacter sp. TaxID=2320200 RepID=UPI0025BE7040|nr:serine/threonine-protein kinase [Abyssibacter sp.]MCK5860344.1 protein kinase [Abyssibacter sp.]
MSEPRIPNTIGTFNIVRVLGEGAMGRVYLAQQQASDRLVALKVLKSTVPEFGRRFSREIRVLGALEHPGIARLYDAGVSDGPAGSIAYFAMEYVAGRDLREAAGDMTLPQQVRLIVTIARAVHAAHLKGVVHRDLKPANILVGKDGAPKVLDFGVAHVADDGGTQMTRVGEVLGTLPYMSFEQMVGDDHAIDARCDVYALGVIAYELFAGALPYPDLPSHSLAGALERLQRGSPQRLSSHCEAARGDLETVVMKAMGFDADQRYASADEFANDLERYLTHQPITARPPTIRYVVGRFVRRHRALSTIAIAAIAAVIVAGLVAAQFAVSEARARALADTRASETAAINAFLSDMLVAVDPANALGKDVRVLDVIDAAELDLQARSALPERVRWSLQRLIGRTRARLGEPGRGVDLLRSVLESIETADGPGSDAALDARIDLASALEAAGEYRSARDALQHPLLGADQNSRQAISAAVLRTRALTGEGQLDEAVALGVATQRRATALLGESDELTMDASYSLAVAWRDAGEYADGIALLEQLVEVIKAKLGALHPETQTAFNLLGTFLELDGQLDAAESVLRQQLAVAESVYPPGHYAIADNQLNLSAVLGKKKQYEESLALATAARKAYEAELGLANIRTLAALNSQAYSLEELGQVDEAEATLRTIIRLQPEIGAAHVQVLAPINNLAYLLMGAGRYDDANQAFAELMERAVGEIGESHPLFGVFEGNQGWCLVRSGREAEGLQVLERAAGRLDATLGPEHARTVLTRERIETTRAKLGKR